MLNYVTIGAVIAACRKSQNIKQIQIATEVGITQAYLSQIESGKRHPHLELLQRIAARFPIKLIDLMKIADTLP